MPAIGREGLYSGLGKRVKAFDHICNMSHCTMVVWEYVQSNMMGGKTNTHGVSLSGTMKMAH